MSTYDLKTIIPSSPAAQEKKEHRRKVLEAVRARRKEIYKRFKENRRAIELQDTP